ncbi:hypothetical protein [Ferroacidibacillus organovorans]|uniref:hypothetical protein n=1 Tax=Ferroacidibacillus organovorans TaxID=1765683 RepID=UPI00083169C9|nr:hypothetical protein [Ferroacidibacillus organovorans]
MDHIHSLLYSYATLDINYQKTKDATYKKGLAMMRTRLRRLGIDILEVHADDTYVYVQYLCDRKVSVHVIETKAPAQPAL